MKYQILLGKVQAGEFGPEELHFLLETAQEKAECGDLDAQQLVDACNAAIAAKAEAGKNDASRE